MNSDLSLRVLLALILVSLVVLVLQGFDAGPEHPSRYNVTVVNGKNPWLMRLDTRTGAVEQLKLKGEEGWVTIGGPASALAPGSVETAAAAPPGAEPERPSEPAPAVAPAEPAPAPKKKKKESVAKLKQPPPPPLPKARPAKVNPQTEIEALSHALSPENPVTIRVWAAEQLGAQGAGAAVPVLAGALGDADTAVVVAAIRALRDSGDPAARSAIEPMLRHSSDDVQQAARQALETP